LISLTLYVYVYMCVGANACVRMFVCVELHVPNLCM